MALGVTEGANRANEPTVILARKVLAVASGLRLSERAFVYGGIVRDTLRGASARVREGLEEATDLDAVVEGDEEEVAALVRQLTERSGGRAIRLSRSFAVYRWSSCVAGRRATVDIQPARNLRWFLEERDVTINAIAVPLENAPAFLAAPATDACIDPTGGVRDLALGKVRTCGPRAFADDPARILRACAFAAWPGFELDEGTAAAARRASGGLGAVSPERLLEPILASARETSTYARFLRLLVTVGASPYVFGDIDLERALPLLGCLERALGSLVPAPTQDELVGIRFVIATVPIVARWHEAVGGSAVDARLLAGALPPRGAHARAFRRALGRWAFAVDAVAGLDAPLKDAGTSGEPLYSIARALARSDAPRIVAACCLCLLESVERSPTVPRPQAAQPEDQPNKRLAASIARMCERAYSLSKSRLMREVANTVRCDASVGGLAPACRGSVIGERILHIKTLYILSGELAAHETLQSRRSARN